VTSNAVRLAFKRSKELIGSKQYSSGRCRFFLRASAAGAGSFRRLAGCRGAKWIVSDALALRLLQGFDP